MTQQRNQNVQLPLLKYFFLNFFSFTIPLYPSFFLVAYYYPLTQKIGIPWYWSWLLFPMVLVGAILLYIFLVIEFATFITRRWTKNLLPIEGVFHRTFKEGNIEDENLKYYHDRGYIIKFPVWLAYKSPFPWLIKRVLTRVGYANVIGKDVTFMETIPTLEFATIRDGVCYYPGSASASHVVDSIFGNLTIKKVMIDENATVFPHTIIGPGVHLDKNNTLMPRSAAIKDWKGISNKNYYSGSPGKPIDTYEGIFSRLPSQLSELYNKQGYLLGSTIDRHIQQREKIQ
ncbi:MAG: hypothetical protein JW776_15830 [Candidatus Lokiarchaeota archaeon]|nr:hypothetical protein [Candidatus Lokiarchaeota archaeon]